MPSRAWSSRARSLSFLFRERGEFGRETSEGGELDALVSVEVDRVGVKDCKQAQVDVDGDLTLDGDGLPANGGVARRQQGPVSPFGRDTHCRWLDCSRMPVTSIAARVFAVNEATASEPRQLELTLPGFIAVSHRHPHTGALRVSGCPCRMLLDCLYCCREQRGGRRRRRALFFLLTRQRSIASFFAIQR